MLDSDNPQNRTNRKPIETTETTVYCTYYV